MDVQNLDLECARAANKINTDIHSNDKSANLVNKAIGVLSGDGLYAFYLFLNSRKQEEEKKVAQVIINKTFDLFKAIRSLQIDNSDLKQTIMTIANDIGKLSLAKDATDKMLIYLRYQLKGSDM